MKINKLLLTLVPLFLIVPSYGSDDPLYPISQNGKWGFMDKSGKVVINPQYENAECFTEGYGRVKHNGTLTQPQMDALVKSVQELRYEAVR